MGANQPARNAMLRLLACASEHSVAGRRETGFMYSQSSEAATERLNGCLFTLTHQLIRLFFLSKLVDLDLYFGYKCIVSENISVKFAEVMNEWSVL